MEAPALADFYATQADAPVGQLPEVIDLTSVSSSSESDEEQPIARRVKVGRRRIYEIVEDSFVASTFPVWPSRV